MKISTIKKAILLSVFCGIVSGVFSGCKKAPPTQRKAPEVTVATPVEKNVRRYHDLTGNTQATESVDIRARVEGFLEKVHFEDGADVQEGDVLFTIEQDVFQVNVEQAQAVLESTIAEQKRAQADLSRVEQAVKTGAVSEQEVDLKRAERDIAKAAVAQAKASLEQANLQLSYTIVTSPITGRISRRYMDVGNLVGSGEKTLLTQVVQFDPIYVYFNFSETLLTRFLKKSGETDQERRASGVKLYIGLADEDGFPHEGFIDYVDNKLDPTTGTVQIRAEFENKKRILYPGMFVRIRIPGLKETAALLVSEKAIGTDLGGKFVLTVGENDIVERRYVIPGQLYDDMRAIEEGIKPGERYIVKGIQRARPGLPVIPKETGTKTNKSANKTADNK